MYGDALISTEDHGANTVSPMVTSRDYHLGGYGAFTSFSKDGKYLYAVAATGAVCCMSADGSDMVTLQLDAAPLCIAPLGSDELLIGTDSGIVFCVRPTAESQPFCDLGAVWIEQLAVSGRGQVAVAAGRQVRLMDENGREQANLGEQISTPTGLVFDSKARRLAVAHYDGVSVWDLKSGSKQHSLQWHGSHTLLSWSPNGEYIATATQDKELHAWRMPKGKSLKMSGYPSKIRSLSWTHDGRYLACAGADTITCWPFVNGGPEGKAPLETGYVFGAHVTMVASHTRRPYVAGGYDNGSILVGSLQTCDALIARAANGERVTGLDWAPRQDLLAVVGERGALSVLQFDAGAFA